MNVRILLKRTERIVFARNGHVMSRLFQLAIHQSEFRADSVRATNSR